MTDCPDRLKEVADGVFRYPPLPTRAGAAMMADPSLLPADQTPLHDALHLTAGGAQARIVLNGQVYALRITKAGKLILTK